MKKILLTRLVPLLMMVCLPLSMLAVNTIIYNATYDFGKMTTGTDTLGGVTYTTVNYDGMFNSGEPGMPSLPVDYIKLSVPYNATNFTVTATLQNSFIGNINHLVYPCQPSRMMNDTTPIVIIPPDASVYNSGSYYPSRNAWVVDEGFLAGENHIVTVAVMPVSYRHRALGSVTTNQLRESQTVRIVLSYDLTDTPSMYPIIRQDSTLRQEGYALTRSMVANPDNVISFAPTQMDMDPLDPNGLITGNELNGGVEPPDPGNISHDTIAHDGGELEQMTYPYLIVTTPELKHSLRRLAALKRQKGYNVKIVTMDEVMNHPYACLGDRIKQSDGTYQVAYSDSAGCLRQYLKFAYRFLGTQYVLLAGKSIPYKELRYIKAGSDSVYTLPTDLYFCDINSDWSFGIEKEPELYVGRIIANSSEQIFNYSNKLFRYELNPGNGDLSYLKRALYTESSDMIGESGYERMYFDSIYPDTTIIREVMWEKTPTGTNIINEINSSQYGFLSFHNHGGPSALITYGFNSHVEPHDYDNTLYWLWAIDSVHIYNSGYAKYDDEILNGLNNLSNKWYPNILYTIGCSTIPYDVLPKYEDLQINFGESFTTGKNYGGPAFIGNTRDGIITKSAELERLFAEQIHLNQTEIGKAEAISKSNYYDLYINLINNLLGDPSLDQWTGIPDQYHDVNIVQSDNTLTITGINNDSTYVSYCNSSEIIRKKLSSSSVTLTNVSPNGSIMLYRHNYIPYIAPMLLQNVTLNKSQYVIASDITAGFSVDSNRTNGDVIVNNGVEYEIEASGTVTFCDGFKVEQGALFTVIPSTFK